MRRLGWLVPVCVAAMQGCVREAPVRVEDRNLGIVVVFPGKPRLHKFSEPTPFGQMEWFSTTYEPPGRFDRSFFVNVGNLPPGDQGGSTEQEVLDTYRTFLARRLGPVETAPLPPDRGAGFRYKAHLPSGGYAEGVAVVRRGRLHQAQATVSRPEDAQLKAFLDSFAVLP